VGFLVLRARLVQLERLDPQVLQDLQDNMDHQVYKENKE
jgi:hypothetical protein